MWSGNKFSSIVDEDKTPDISLTSSEGDHLDKMDFTRIKLDSDEDEMRIDYMNGSKLDANNNIVDDDSDSEKPLNIMQNIQFAELQFDQLQLSDNEAPQKLDDFLPNVYNINFSDNEDKDGDGDSEVSTYNPGNNIKFMSSIESEQQDGNHSSVHTDIEEIKTESIRSSAVESTIHSTIESVKSNYYDSDFTPETQPTSPSNNDKPHKSANNDEFSTSPDGKHSSHRKQKRSKSSRHTRTTSTSARSQSVTGSLTSTSSLTSDSDSSQSSFKKSRRRHDNSKHKPTKHSNTAVQTDFIPNTNDILNFKYPWQHDKPHNIAAHVVDGETLHVLTSYDPSVLAAHDMMKFHFKLLQQHVDNSRRLYQAYSQDTGHSKFKYTTVEDTMEFIEKNRPKVQTYQEVLKQIKSDN